MLIVASMPGAGVPSLREKLAVTVCRPPGAVTAVAGRTSHADSRRVHVFSAWQRTTLPSTTPLNSTVSVPAAVPMYVIPASPFALVGRRLLRPAFGPARTSTVTGTLATVELSARRNVAVMVCGRPTRFVAIAGYEWTSQAKYWTQVPPPEVSERLYPGPPKYYNHKCAYFLKRAVFMPWDLPEIMGAEAARVLNVRAGDRLHVKVLETIPDVKDPCKALKFERCGK